MVTNFQSQNSGCLRRSVLCALVGALLLAATVAQAQKVHKTFIATKTSSAITLDGVFDESAWGKGKNFKDTLTDQPGNNTAIFGVTWDDTKLYVGIKVLDVPPFHTNTTDTWNNDGCEFAFDGGNAKSEGYWGYAMLPSEWKYELHVGVASDTNLYHHNANQKPEQGDPGDDTNPVGSCHIKKLSDGYTMELGILWTSVRRGLSPTTPAIGDTMGFDLANNDCDSVAGGTISQGRWDGDASDTQWFANPSTWGNLVLGDENGGGVGVAGDVPPVPQTFMLEQNYPNPFNPSTTIDFTLAEDSRVTLKVFDLIGREVATLVNNDLKAGMKHSVKFDASRLSTGMYFYRLDTGKNSMVKKLLLTK